MIKSLLIIAVVSLSMMIFTPTFVAAQGIPDADKDAACKAFDDNGCTPGPGDATFTGIWDSVLNVATFVVGLVSVLMIIIGGLRYVLSNGDPQGTQNAKNTIIYAIVGLIVAIAARAIVFLVLTRVG